MKDSKIEWIGLIPENWEVCRIKDKYKLITGFTPDTTRDDYYDDNGYTWISIADMTNSGKEVIESSTKISDIYIRTKHPEVIKKGSLMYSFKLSVGKVGFAGKDLYSNEAIASFKNTEDVYLPFLYYASFLIEENANINIYGAKILNQDLINNSITVFPPLQEQKEIVNYLDGKIESVDEIIKDLNNQIDILEKYKKSLITETVTKGLNPYAKMKDSGIEWIGEIPEGWEIKKIKYLLKQNCINLRVGPFGSSLSGDDFKDEGHWVYTQRSVLDNNFKTNDTFVNNEKFNELSNFKVFPNDILITTRGTIGKVAIVPGEAPEGILHPCLIKFRIDENTINNELLKYIFNDSSIIENQIFKYSNSTTIEVIYSNTLKNLFIPVIPYKEQLEIISYLDKKINKIDSVLSRKIKIKEKIEMYRKSLIYEYITGKKRVKGVYDD